MPTVLVNAASRSAKGAIPRRSGRRAATSSHSQKGCAAGLPSASSARMVQENVFSPKAFTMRGRPGRQTDGLFYFFETARVEMAAQNSTASISPATMSGKSPLQALRQTLHGLRFSNRAAHLPHKKEAIRAASTAQVSFSHQSDSNVAEGCGGFLISLLLPGTRVGTAWAVN